MPQPISRVVPNAEIHIGNSTDSPSRHRPQMALLAMNVIAEWSILESQFSSILVKMLGANPGPAAAIYSALTSDSARKAAFRAIARISLSQDEQDVLEAILDLFSTAAKGRNKIAHWVWGHSPQIPDAVLLCDPEALTAFNLSIWQPFDGRIRAMPELPTDAVFVFKAADFINLSEQIQRLMLLSAEFRFVIMRDPRYVDDQLFQRLSREPEIQTFLDRLRDRQKTAEEAQPPPRP